MKIPEDYLEKNRQAWNKRTTVHIGSDFYDVDGFKAGKTSLRHIELDLLPSLNGKKVLHLQCHFGLDTLSMARMGADITGVDISDDAISQATKLSEETGIPSRFIRCDIYDLPKHLDETFDLIYSTYGTIGWLPDMNRWAKLVSKFLRPGGELLLIEFHPVVWMYDEDFTKIKYDYFNREAIVETTSGSYTDRNAAITYTEVSWNHPISEVINALLKEKLTLKSFLEYDHSPYNCFNNMEEHEKDSYRIKGIGKKMPMVYAIQATK